MTHGGVVSSGAMSRLQLLASYWSATIHDYEHQGVNNDFLIRTSHPLAITYNDISPLENHHISASAALIQHEEYQFVPVSSCIAHGALHSSLRFGLQSCSQSDTAALQVYLSQYQAHVSGA